MRKTNHNARNKCQKMFKKYFSFNIKILKAKINCKMCIEQKNVKLTFKNLELVYLKIFFA